MVDGAPDDAAEVVAAIDVVAYPGEAVLEGAVARPLPTDVDFRCAQDVGVARAAEGVVDASVAQVDVRVAADETFVAAAVEVLRLGQRVGALALGIAGKHAVHVDRGAVLLGVCVSSAAVLLAHDALFAASENLEGVAVVVVHGGASPYLGVLTIAGAEHRQGNGHHVLDLVVEADAGAALAAAGEDAVLAVAVHDVLIDVDDDVAVHVSAVVAAAIDVALHQAAVRIVGSITVAACPYFHEAVRLLLPLHRVPLQLGQSCPCHLIVFVFGAVGHFCTLGFELSCTGIRGVVGLALRQRGAVGNGHVLGAVQALGLQLEALEGQLQAVLDVSALRVAAFLVLCRSAADAALVGGVQSGLGRHVGIVAAAHYLVVYNQLMVYLLLVLSGVGHAAHVAAQEEGADIAAVFDV